MSRAAPSTRARPAAARSQSSRVPCPPVEQRLHDRAEALALVGQAVLRARRVLLVVVTLDDALVLQRLQARRQRVRADAGEGTLEVLELARPIGEEVAQHHDRPTLPDDVESARDRALHVVGHDATITE